MSFGWSAGDIVAALRLLNKVRIALTDSGGAACDYQEQTVFLQTVSITLNHLDALQHEPLDPDICDNLRQHCELIRPSLRRFLSTADRSFEASLGAATAKSKLLSTPRRLQWALSTSKEVRSLRSKIGSSLSAIQVVVSQQIV